MTREEIPIGNYKTVFVRIVIPILFDIRYHQSVDFRNRVISIETAQVRQEIGIMLPQPGKRRLAAIEDIIVLIKEM